MSISMYSASIPVFVKLLTNMQNWLERAQAHADSRKFDSANYLGMRLAPDMLPLSRQIQIATDAAKGCVARLAGVDNPKFEDNEATVADLRERLAKTLAFVKTATPAQIDGTEEKVIELPRPNGEKLVLNGESFLKHFALANFYFHATTTYALLRHAGVELGKRDFLA